MSTATTRPSQVEPSRARALLARGAGMEKIVYAAIGRAITRKPWKARDAKGFHYHAQSLAVLVVLIVLSAVEILVIDLIVHQWLWLRIPLLIIGIWGLVWMTGLLCAHFMRPHTVGTGYPRPGWSRYGCARHVGRRVLGGAEEPQLRAQDSERDR